MKKGNKIILIIVILFCFLYIACPIITISFNTLKYNEKIDATFSEDSLWVDENGRFSLEIDGQKDRMVLYDEDNPTNPICILIRTKMLEMFDYNSEFKNEDYFEIESYPYDVSWQYTPDVLTLEISKLFDYTPGTNHPSFLDIDENETIEIKFIRLG